MIWWIPELHWQVVRSFAFRETLPLYWFILLLKYFIYKLKLSIVFLHFPWTSTSTLLYWTYTASIVATWGIAFHLNETYNLRLSNVNYHPLTSFTFCFMKKKILWQLLLICICNFNVETKTWISCWLIVTASQKLSILYWNATHKWQQILLTYRTTPKI